MAEVQQKLYVAMREVRYEPFTYVWDLVAARFPRAIATARERRPREATRNLARRYLEGVIFAAANHLLSVVGDRSRLEQAVTDLVQDGVIDAECRIDGLAGKWLAVSRETRERLATAHRVEVLTKQ